MFNLYYPKFWQDKASLISIILLPLSLVYFILGRIRHKLCYKINLPIPVICIGNITVGGTGKTQMVLYIARYLQRHNRKVCILCKGYKGKLRYNSLVDRTKHSPREVGDEAFMLANYFPVIVYKNIASIPDIIKQHRFEVAIFDDGMQNPAFTKDLTILMIDGLRGFGNERLIPAGPLREPIKDACFKTDINVILGEDRYNISRYLKGITIQGKIMPTTFFDKSVGFIAFTGIGNPNKFFLTLMEMRLNIIDTKIFPDHHEYSKIEIEKLYNYAQTNSCFLITTEKDWVKIPKNFQDKIKFVEVNLDLANCNKLYGLLNEKIIKKAQIPN